MLHYIMKCLIIRRVCNLHIIIINSKQCIFKLKFDEKVYYGTNIQSLSKPDPRTPELYLAGPSTHVVPPVTPDSFHHTPR